MLLVLAHPGDVTADRLAAFAHAAGVPCARPASWREADASVFAERDGTTRVRLTVDGVPVRAVLNRGLPFTWTGTGDEGFRCHELMGAWWAALASFPGPVVNRPTRLGFLPGLDPTALAAAVPGILRRGWIGSAGGRPATLPPGVAAAPVVNVHRLRDGFHVGRLGPALALDPGEPYLYTPFDPARTVRLLFAGDRLLDAGDTSGGVRPELEEKLAPLVAELRRREARFARLVVEEVDGGFHLLQSNAFPHVHQYRSLEDEVHRALLEYLGGGVPA